MFLSTCLMFTVFTVVLTTDITGVDASWDVETFTDQIERLVTQDGHDEADFYYPVVSEPERPAFENEFPLVVMLQGATVDKGMYSNFSTQLASYGYVVVVPNHIQELGEFAPPDFFASQWTPTDVLADIQNRDRNDSSPLYLIVDTDHAGICGHSNGGAAALFATTRICQPPFCFGRNYSRPDAYIAAVVHGTHTVPIFDPQATDLEPLDVDNEIPVALINGDLDQMEHVCATWIFVEEEKDLVILEGVNHWGLADMQPSEAPEELEQSQSQEWSIEQSSKWTAVFLDAHLKGDSDAYLLLDTSKGEAGVYLNQHCPETTTEEQEASGDVYDVLPSSIHDGAWVCWLGVVILLLMIHN